MKSFILGACVGLTLAGAGSVGAQLAPFDAPLDEQIQAQRAEWYLRTQREVEAMERENRRLTEERLAPPMFPVPRPSAIDEWITQKKAEDARIDTLREAREREKLDRAERELYQLQLLNALDDLKRRR